MEPLLKLHVQEDIGTRGLIAVSWCITPGLLSLLKETEAEGVKILFVIAPQEEYTTDRELRVMCPMTDGLAYLPFRAKGPHKIFAFVLCESNKRTKDGYKDPTPIASFLEKGFDGFRYRILSYGGQFPEKSLRNTKRHLDLRFVEQSARAFVDHHPSWVHYWDDEECEWIPEGTNLTEQQLMEEEAKRADDNAANMRALKTLHNPVWTEVLIDIPETAFASEPPAWLASWVNYYYRQAPRDQCEFRERCFWAFTILPVRYLCSMTCRLITCMLCLLFGQNPDWSTLTWKTMDLGATMEAIPIIPPPKGPWYRYVPHLALYLYIPIVHILLICGVSLYTNGGVWPSWAQLGGAVIAAQLLILKLTVGGTIFAGMLVGMVFVGDLVYSVLAPWFKRFKEACLARASEQRRLAHEKRVREEAEREAEARRLEEEQAREVEERVLINGLSASFLMCEPAEVQAGEDSVDAPHIQQVADLPREQRSLRLRFFETKAKVCRPYSS